MKLKPSRNKSTYVQFSKRMAVFVIIFWAVYRIANLIILALNPGVGGHLKDLLTGADDVAMVSIGFYTGNSVIEKGIVGYFNARAGQNTGTYYVNEDEENG